MFHKIFPSRKVKIYLEYDWGLKIHLLENLCRYLFNIYNFLLRHIFHLLRTGSYFLLVSKYLSTLPQVINNIEINGRTVQENSCNVMSNSMITKEISYSF